MSARALVWLAVALRAIDIALGPWGSPPPIFSLMWCLVLVVTAIALRSSSRAGLVVVLGVALVSDVSAFGILRPTDPDMDLLVPFFQLRRLLWVGEAVLIMVAAGIAVRTALNAWPRRDVVPTPLALRRPLLIGAGCWSAALALIFWWPGNVWANYLLSPLIPLALLLRFWLTRQLGRADAIIARIAGWIGVLSCLLTLTPIAYGLVIIYLLMTARGNAIFGFALIGTFALLTGAGQLRKSLRSAATAGRPYGDLTIVL